MDLWQMLGVSPKTGVMAAVALLVLAGLIAWRQFRRSRAGPQAGPGLSLHDGR